MTPQRVLRATEIAMNQPDSITLHGGLATVAEARDLNVLGFTLDGVRYVSHSCVAQASEYDPAVSMVNVVGLPDAESLPGWVLLLG